MRNKLDNLIGADISREHLSWAYPNMSNVNIQQDDLYRAYMPEEPDLRGMMLRRVENFIEIIHHLQLSLSTERLLEGRKFMEQQYWEGKILNLPKRKPLTQEEQLERQQLAELFASDELLSDVVIKDRGPY